MHPPIDMRVREFVTGDAQGDEVLRPIEQVQIVPMFAWLEARYLGLANDVVSVDFTTRAADCTCAASRHV